MNRKVMGEEVNCCSGKNLPRWQVCSDPFLWRDIFKSLRSIITRDRQRGEGKIITSTNLPCFTWPCPPPPPTPQLLKYKPDSNARSKLHFVYFLSVQTSPKWHQLQTPLVKTGAIHPTFSCMLEWTWHVKQNKVAQSTCTESTNEGFNQCTFSGVYIPCIHVIIKLCTPESL